MRLQAAIFLCLIASLPAAAQELNCDQPENLPQQGMNMCAFEDWQKADRALNEAWPKVRAWAKANDEATIEWRPELADTEDNLLKAQRAWIAYRDGHCETEGLRYAGGSIVPLIVNSCKAEMTRQRTEELILLLEDG
ncbi:MAG: lysozyme inhibitor LprI family protein [Pseudomonadota bacterium]